MKELLSIKLIEEDDGLLSITTESPVSGGLLDQLMQALSRVRPSIDPPVPAEGPSVLEPEDVVRNPVFAVGEVHLVGRVIGFRHPSFGWVWFHRTPELRTALQEDELVPPMDFRQQMN